MKLGIVDSPLAKQRSRGGRGGAGGREGIFKAEQLRALLVGLVCSADRAKPPRDEGDRKMFQDFEFIDGHPHVRPFVLGLFCYESSVSTARPITGRPF